MSQHWWHLLCGVIFVSVIPSQNQLTAKSWLPIPLSLLCRHLEVQRGRSPK